jgi:hypothetical protein
MRNIGNANNKWKVKIRESKGGLLVNEQTVKEVSADMTPHNGGEVGGEGGGLEE